MPVYQLFREQKINASVEEIWDFISSPKNLKRITPDYMGFDISSKGLPEKMYPGIIIRYKVSPLLNIKLTWVTEIKYVEENKYFVDEQRVGPYKIWHHQHILIPLEKGVLMKDIVTYQPPLGFLGGIANFLFIENQLNQIFDYRRKAIEEIYGKFR